MHVMKLYYRECLLEVFRGMCPTGCTCFHSLFLKLMYSMRICQVAFHPPIFPCDLGDWLIRLGQLYILGCEQLLLQALTRVRR